MAVDGIMRLLFALVVAFTLNVAAAGVAFAAEYYMSPSGNDSNPGTLAAPWKTLDRLQVAQKILKPGDTVYFKGGDYVITDSAARSYYSWGADGVTYKNYNGETPVIIHDRIIVNPSSQADRGTFFLGGDNIIIDGLSFRQSDRSRAVTMLNNKPILANPQGGAFMISAFRVYASGTKFRNCSITNYSGTGIFTGSSTLVENCRFETGGHNLYIAQANSIVRYNIFDSSRGHKGQRGIQIQYDSAKNNRVYGNLIRGGQASGIVFSGPVSGNEVFNNVFINSGDNVTSTYGYAVDFFYYHGRPTTGNKFYNNTLIGKSRSGLISPNQGPDGIPTSINVPIYNNVFYPTPSTRVGLNTSNVKNNIFYNVTGSIPPGNIQADPKLANPTGTQPLDAMLTAASTAAIDKAISGAPPFDYQHGARPFGPASDIGAFEFGATPGSGGPLEAPPSSGSGGGNGSPPAICSIRPGNKFRGHINSWWNSGLKPAMMNMVAELYTTKVDQSRNLGTFIDTQNQQQAARQIQVREAEAVKRYQPSEVVCEAASVMPALTSTSMISRAVSQGYRMDFAGDATNRKGGSTANGVAQDVNTRWKEYTTRFCDPAANKGNAGCATAGPLPDADVAVENLLFKESIDLGDPNVQAATKALLRNLTQPRADNPVPPAALNSPSGQEAILRRKHLQTLRTLSAGVVGDIIGRRAQVPLATLGTGSSPAADTQIAAIRAAAGVPAAQISRNPSYNEIMLAMTKERFLNPHYFVRLGAGEGAIEQEQASLDAYTSLMLQDIYELQEQINALMAARASMKFREGFTDRKTGLMPLK